MAKLIRWLLSFLFPPKLGTVECSSLAYHAGMTQHAGDVNDHYGAASACGPLRAWHNGKWRNATWAGAHFNRLVIG